MKWTNLCKNWCALEGWTHGIDGSQYGKYERGRDMQISTILRILSIYDMSIEEFFTKGFGRMINSILDGYP